MIDPNQEADFSAIPGMPDDDTLRDEIVSTGNWTHWNPYGSGEREPFDPKAHPEATVQRVLGARLTSGPGPHANKFQRTVWEQWHRTAELDKEQERILATLDEVDGYDPVTGDGIPAVQSPEKRRAMQYRLAEIADDKARLEGEAGQRALEKALQASIKDRKARLRREYIQAEAKRRAASSTIEDEIERAAAGYRRAGRK